MKAFWLLVPFALMVIAPGCSAGTTGEQVSISKALVPLTVMTLKGQVKLKVEVARTPEEQARGLMFRESLPADGGMIFPLDPPRHASFWMKNTVIPLDMIFIRSDGSIARIEPETTPQSLTPVPSGEPVAAVLELAGGRASALGIAEGDRVTWNDSSR
jgi:uncharacterized protein